MDTATIKVRRDHIEQGEPENEDSCPIALAIKEQLYTNDVAVGESTLYIEGARVDDHMSRHELSKLTDFVLSFDRGKHPQPIDLRVPIPENVK